MGTVISILTESIFCVRNREGQRIRVGLRDLITNAHIYTDLLGRTPTGRYALMRLCIAFLEDMLQPEDLEAREELFGQGKFDPQKLDDYIADCEKDGPRFLLDDPKHPFMQAAFDPQLDALAEKPIAALLMDVPSGNNHVHTDHRMETEHVMSIADAFEALLETYTFCPAGLSGPSGVNNTPPVYFILNGRNLFETFVLNMVSDEELQNIPFGADDVPWRKTMEIMPRKQVEAMTYLRAYTWQPRRVTLKFDDDGRVSSCWMQPGLDFRGDGRWRDPHTAAFLKKDGTLGILKPEPGRQIWRNVGNLLAGMDSDSIRPVTFANRSAVWTNVQDGIVRIEAIGLQTNQAACVGWTQETLLLPEAFLQDAEKADAFRACVNIGEDIVGYLAATISKELGTRVSEQACTLFLQFMHDALFDSTMVQIMNWESNWKCDFVQSVENAVHETLKRVVYRSGASVEILKRQGTVAAKLMYFTNEKLKGW